MLFLICSITRIVLAWKITCKLCRAERRRRYVYAGQENYDGTADARRRAAVQPPQRCRPARQGGCARDVRGDADAAADSQDR